MRYILDLIAENINTNQLQNAYDLIIENEEFLTQNAEYWNLRGILCLKVEEYSAAISCLSKAIELDEFNGDFYYNYAYAFERIGSQSDAALYYGKAYKYLNDQSIKTELAQMYVDNEALKNIFVTAAEEKKKTFIILSSNIWRDVYQRTHHISRALAKFGHHVQYVERVRSTISEGRTLSVTDLLEYSLKSVKLVDGVSIFSPVELLDENQNVLESNYIELVQSLLHYSLSNNEEVVIITYLPSQINVIKSLKGNFYHIYECVDDHSDLEYSFWGHKNDFVWEQELMDSANAITTTASALYLQRTAIEQRKNVFLSRNAVNELDFLCSSAQEIPHDMQYIPEPRIVYTGALYDWFDVELFYQIVRSNPDKSFVIIGFGNTDLLIEPCPNLFFLGEKKHSELKKYLKHMQVGIIPFKDNTDIIINCDPIKQYEYIASSIPVIGTYMPEVLLDKEYSFIANNCEKFNVAINKYLKMTLNDSVIDSFVSRNNWNVRAALLSNLANKRIDENYIEKEQNHLGSQLYAISRNYKSPVFLALFSMYSNLNNKIKYQEGLKQAYEKFERVKFVERQYLISLISTNQNQKFAEIYSKSSWFKQELLKELQYRIDTQDYSVIPSLEYLCMNDVKNFFTSIEFITNSDTQKMYKMYLDFIQQSKVSGIELTNIESEEKSPLYLFLSEKNESTVSIYVSNLFDDNTIDITTFLKANGLNIDGYCSHSSYTHKISIDTPIISLDDLLLKQQNDENIKLIVIYDSNYVKQIRSLAEYGIKECEVAVSSGIGLEFVRIDANLMKKIRDKDYLKTVVFNKFNAADSNVEALLKYIPREYKDMFNIHVIYGRDIYLTENVVKAPLIASVTVSGFSTFLYLPKFTFNIEIGHGGLPLKACGLMDKKDKQSGGTQEVYNNADVVCIASTMEQIVRSSFYAIPENKYKITGLARNDMLCLADGKANLQKLLGAELDNKTIIFNMPTFHLDEKRNRVEGDLNLIDSFLISGFNYEEFNDFLKASNMICVSKVHHGEENAIAAKTKNRANSNLFFIDNHTLQTNGLDLYEILNAADILITDYSTVYNDFLFMNKPIIFVNTDIDKYREERGLVLEPYDFWTAGPKVSRQQELHEELEKYTLDKDYYRSEREKLLPVFFKHTDANSVQRTWEVIHQAFNTLEA
ncbi:CDP-glycerol glycerophosphotransferase family protein [Paenibacillus medicaginis]|uniref:CDP-glycerol glycerophosphotransferase family protein n=1 Tax=Paenibacillus medicaginis TaxID=1470560 RepID=A0ABV5BXH8_9BACL